MTDDLDVIKEEVFNILHGRIKEQLREIIKELYRNPEVGGEEFNSSDLLIRVLSDWEFDTKRGVAELPTAFVGTFCAGQNSKPKIAFMAEYDALPVLGHACGHNVSCTASVGAAMSFAMCLKKWRLDGTAIVLGTPGEENLGGKVDLLEAGVFKDIDAAMMIHSSDKWLLDPKVMALDALELNFKGKAAHAAGAPEKGINALDAINLTFSGINCLRQHIMDGCRIHGIITKGGDAPGIVPETAAARIYIRAINSEYLADLSQRVKNCARGAALATGCTLEISSFEHHTDSLKSNHTILDLFATNLGRLIKQDNIIRSEPKNWASTDAGNVSYAVPTIHPLMAVAPDGVEIHTPEFAEATITAQSVEAATISAYAMACTALDLAIRREIWDAIKEEFGESGR
ncbi:MAG: M20 family metallopeptidase [Chloroflexota bacterium]